MRSLKGFFKESAIPVKNVEVAVSRRFVGEDGKILKFEVKSISNEEDDRLRKQFTSQKLIKKGMYKPELDVTGFYKALVIKCTVFPDFNNAELQNTYSVMCAEDLLDIMLLPGEYNTLLQEIQSVNGWDVDMEEKKDEVKN